MRCIIVLICTMMINSAAFAQSFKTRQLTFERVKDAYQLKWPDLEKKIIGAGFGSEFSMFITAYKQEGLLDIWLKNKKNKEYTLFKSYKFCEHSGTLGPKFREGDLQTPEGFYYINVFNPLSSFHLSLGINYPNPTDVLRSGKEPPGTDIYIHGNCVTVGCIPLTDDLIKEVYVLGVEAKNNGQEKIPVYIYPFKMSEENYKKFIVSYPAHTKFWASLKEEYARFNKQRTLRNDL
ncbi:MAG: hypothetical protein EOO89_30615 [Pedobacter sp.]|nr:MAG: hypothetical protein EOO89_30615 [Pedobacter sp.]